MIVLDFRTFHFIKRCIIIFGLPFSIGIFPCCFIRCHCPCERDRVYFVWGGFFAIFIHIMDRLLDLFGFRRFDHVWRISDSHFAIFVLCCQTCDFLNACFVCVIVLDFRTFHFIKGCIIIFGLPFSIGIFPCCFIRCHCPCERDRVYFVWGGFFAIFIHIMDRLLDLFGFRRFDHVWRISDSHFAIFVLCCQTCDFINACFVCVIVLDFRTFHFVKRCVIIFSLPFTKSFVTCCFIHCDCACKGDRVYIVWRGFFAVFIHIMDHSLDFFCFR